MQNWPPKWEPGKFSPIQSRFSTLDINRLSKSDEIKEEYQKQKLKGFTVGELVNLDAFTSRMLKKGDLTNEIHWLLHKERWEREPRQRYPRNQLYIQTEPFAATWYAHDDDVWAAMMPSLQLASIVLENLHMMPWLAGLVDRPLPLLDDERKEDDIRNDPVLSQIPFKTFTPPGTVDEALVEQTKSRIEDLMKILVKRHKLLFGLKHPLRSPWWDTDDDALGVSLTDSLDCTSTYISCGLVLPLFRTDLTDLERKGAEWTLAVTIVHEIMHDLWAAQFRRHTTPGPFTRWPTAHLEFEPYFGNDAFTELGWSMESKVLGGIIQPMNEHFVCLEGPMGYWMTPTEQNIADVYVTGSVYWKKGKTYDFVLKKPQLDNFIIHYPVTASFLEGLQTSEFWDLGVKKFGPKVMHIRTPTPAAITYYSGLGPENEIDYEGFSEDFQSRHEGHINDDIRDLRNSLGNAINKDMMSLTPVERKAFNLARRLLREPMWEAEFWTKRRNMTRAIKRMVGNPAWTQSRGLSLVQELVTLHQQAVDTALLLAQSSSDNDIWNGIRDDIHQSLFIWNSEAREFVLSDPAVQRLRQQDAEEDAKRTQIAYDLEIARMCLRQPNQMPGWTCIISVTTRYDQRHQPNRVPNPDAMEEEISRLAIMDNSLLNLIIRDTVAVTIGVDRGLLNPQAMNGLLQQALVYLRNIRQRIEDDVNGTKPLLGGGSGIYATVIGTRWRTHVRDWEERIDRMVLELAQLQP